MAFKIDTGEALGGMNYGNGSRLFANNAPALSFCCWLNLENIDEQGIFDCTKNSSSSRIEAAIDPSGYLVVGGRGDDGDSFNSYNSGVLASTGFHHYAFVLDYVQDTAEIYKDGVSVGSNTNMGWTSPTSNTAPVYCSVGYYNTAGGEPPFMQGAMHDMRLYKRALDAGEVRTIFASRGNDYIINDLDLWIKAEGVAGDAITTSNIIDSIHNWPPIGVYGTMTFTQDNLSFRRRN